jgi:hypothetical protein
MTRLNLACGPHILPGFDNLDQNLNGWRFEEGLGDYVDGSVEAITISHGLLYLPIPNWPYVFKEIARVLEPGGIVRITEDDTEDPESERFGGWHDAVTLTSEKLVATHLRKAKLIVQKVDADTTMFTDRSLIQAHHGAPPKVFFIEGRKPA